MKITFNNQIEDIGQDSSIASLLQEKNLSRRVSVWVNGKQLLLKEYEIFILRDGDQVKVVRIVAGG